LFAKCGARVAVIDINEMGGNETVQLINQNVKQTHHSEKIDSIFVKADVSNSEGDSFILF
jgi:23S rRNA U2552 (ribose-2'-O)-methylase RlmE/FtsJ